MFVPLLASLAFSQGVQDPILLQVNAQDAPRNRIQVIEQIPVRPGPFLLRYPKWIPGEHRPTGTIVNVVNFHVYANGKELPWVRDPVNLFDIRVNVPTGVPSIQVAFEDVEQPGDVFSSRLGRLKWNRVVFAPKGPDSRIMVRASLKAPAGWTVQTALPVSSGGDVIQFQDVSLERLVDSPVQMGLNAKTVQIAPGHFLDMLADDPENLEMKPETLQGIKNLVAEAHALWGAQHYREYHWLLTLSNFSSGEGLEHHESSEDGVSADALKNGQDYLADLLSHEYTHSWNGKYRRPAGLWQPDLATPQDGTLLWVYEGMTQYWGYVLPMRTGLWTKEHYLDVFASDAASNANRSGRSWRSVADTATSVYIVRDVPRVWQEARRGTDYYSEGALVWLGVDATLRRLTNNQKSLDDFCRKFYGGENSAPKVVTYTLEDIVETLNSVAPYDWAGYLKRAIYDVHPKAPTEGLEAAGWRLVLNEQPSGGGGRRGGSTRRYDLGISIDSEGKITDMEIGSPADRAMATPGMKLLAVNDRPYSADVLADALRAAKTAPQPIRVQVVKDGLVSTLSIDYHEGPKSPHLERIEGMPDYLSDIGKPRAPQK